jgi:primosomal protein N' (replication factor Y) (superfamily II helicase)
MTEHRLKVAVPGPFPDPLDYFPGDAGDLRPGMRVQVPLGRRQVIGVVVAAPEWVEASDGLHCRPVTRSLDPAPLLPDDILALCRWASAYYHHPVGEVFAAALPGALRKAPAARPRAPRSRPIRPGEPGNTTAAAPHAPTPEQAAVLAALAEPGAFQVSLLEGVTGSGKTEIYLQRVQAALEAGRQALVLTPEIGLTPQLELRFRERFGDAVALFHSGLTEKARADAWHAARAGRCRVLVGTRSAVFTPLPQLGLVVVDEEHDPSYKQQEGFRYSARDVAIVRGQRAGVPVILGSATPSLESLHNVARGRYRHLRLAARPGERRLPKIQLLDLRGVKLRDGLAPELVDALAHHLDQGGQALLFVNRRGYAPALLCHDCGWLAPCPHCDARMTLHRTRGRLVCHHCGSESHVPLRCAGCGGSELIPVGQGTERIEEGLRRLFPDVRVERIDSDRTRRAGELGRLLHDIRTRQVRVLVGTQMLAKGHDFDGLTLVGVVDTDPSLYSTDFRAIERMGQLLTQVAGRAGRGGVPGEVIVQTHQPDHPHLQCWLQEGYAGLSRRLLDERREMGFPPCAHLALLRADALDAGTALRFLKDVATRLPAGEIDALGPVPAPMERKANRFRAQLLLRSADRGALQSSLKPLIAQIGQIPGSRRVRWSIDVDPIDLY